MAWWNKLVKPKGKSKAEQAKAVADLAPLDQPEKEESSEEEEEEDQVTDLPEQQEPAFYLKRKQRQSVSAEAYGEWNKKSAFTAPNYPKNEEQTARIKAALAKGFMFNCLDKKDLQTVIGAFVEVKVPQGETIIKQGDDGDRLYLIEEGQFDVFKLLPGESEPKHMIVMGVGDAVGELALLYNCPRAATVTAKTNCVVWALDRESFNHIVRDAASRQREMHEAFLAEVKLFRAMEPYERSKLADALRTVEHAAGDTIITEGDTGDTFYILESGTAEALKGDQVVMKYKRGDYFGELALIKDQPRAATIKATSDVKCVYLDRRSFKRLLGPVDAILRRNAEQYTKLHRQFTQPADGGRRESADSEATEEKKTDEAQKDDGAGE